MTEMKYRDSHEVWWRIKRERGIKFLDGTLSLWKLKINEKDYEDLKKTLRDNRDQLQYFGTEAALCYGEWWRREYEGGIPSKEDVALGVGLSRYCAEDLYKAARAKLDECGYVFIKSKKGTEFFRTLLNQGGLPIHYINRRKNDFGGLSRFLAGLVKDLASINFDWALIDESFITKLPCFTCLPTVFQNEGLYDVAIQIAHAIIEEDETLLPFDHEEKDLWNLSKAIKREYSFIKKKKPLSLDWGLYLRSDGQARLYVNFTEEEILSSAIPGIDYERCITFDILIEDTVVGKYTRKEMIQNAEGKCSAVYSRLSGVFGKGVKWTGQPVLEVRVRCDTGERFELQILGCFPPNFELPQVFQRIEGNLYSRSEKANVEDNVVIYNEEWTAEGETSLYLHDLKLKFVYFVSKISLLNQTTKERKEITNKFSAYSVEYSTDYVNWIEKSNFKIIKQAPRIKVYNKEKKLVNEANFFYREKKKEHIEWLHLNEGGTLPLGLIEIKVELPDGSYEKESFFNVGNLELNSQDEDLFSTELICSCSPEFQPEIEKSDNLDIVKNAPNKWKITRKLESNVCGYPFVLCVFTIAPAVH